MGLIFVSRPDSLFYGCVSAQELGKETHSWINLCYTLMILELKRMLGDGTGITEQPKISFPWKHCEGKADQSYLGQMS